MFKLDDLKTGRQAWIRKANIPTNRLGWELDDCTAVPQKTLKQVKDWLDLVKSGEVIRKEGSINCGLGLALDGAPGQGKTTFAVAILQEAMKTFSLAEWDVKENSTIVRPCYFISYSGLLRLRGEMIGNESSSIQDTLYHGIMGDLPPDSDSQNVRLLVLDDMGKEHNSGSGFNAAEFHHLIRNRFNKGLPTIITTNVATSNWSSLYGEASASFAQEAFLNITLKSEKGDLRR